MREPNFGTDLSGWKPQILNKNFFSRGRVGQPKHIAKQKPEIHNNKYVCNDYF